MIKIELRSTVMLRHFKDFFDEIKQLNDAVPGYNNRRDLFLVNKYSDEILGRR